MYRTNIVLILYSIRVSRSMDLNIYVPVFTFSFKTYLLCKKLELQDGAESQALLCRLAIFPKFELLFELWAVREERCVGNMTESISTATG